MAASMAHYQGHLSNRITTGRAETVGQAQYPPRRAERKYKLEVEQQPIRARMCGFGDKDRRPITPPPCIRLVVLDEMDRELDFNEIDSTYFVLMVDLWNESGQSAVNLVRHSSAAPTVSISSSTTTSYPPPPERSHYVATTIPGYDAHSQAYRHQQHQHQHQHQHMQPQPMAAAGYGPGAHTGVAVPPYYPPTPQPPTPTYQQYPAPAPAAPYGQAPAPSAMIPATPMSSNHTRNLIGMNAVNACRLNDTKNKPGFWFVLQDLSVRTEGTFRLKLFLFDIGAGDGTNATVAADGPTRGKGKCLAVNFSDPFTVYSAKKFPGVIESTPLSKCFAQQGIKIPIRKDGPKLPNQAEYDADD
ncbi:hypothetical protein COCHEDRAFT_33742 [Bipolaris maydis C5]|uniref:Velvet complex subunit 2 n=2 Tax=Cochliobolus heterostrophus TaxID=5016 RepID=VELB_COCH5|nr:RecName: Full=Velvet complex subunit 2 [Bipolaris maydis C5]EMD85134.1 hypothetical protein COCHEDRAFT_33742 [Bipolaris maydis C5]KAJ6205431.1 velvet factor [Bipolaris maydis]